MKKIFLIIVTTIMTTTAWSQSQLQTVKGKDAEGKNINVQYYKGTAQDRIVSVKYQKVDELEAEKKSKQRTIDDLQYQLNNANKNINNLKEQLKNSGNSGQIAELQEQLSQKQSEIEQLNDQNAALNAQLKEMQAENERLRRQMDSIKEVNRLLSLNKNRPAKSPVIGVEASMGSVFLSKSSLSDPWEKMLSWNKQASIYFGTGRLADGLPLSIEAGVGFRSLPMKAKINDYQATNEIPDCDNDMYQLIIDNCLETLTVNCLEVPVRFCLGQPDNNKVSVYGKVGVTPSFILSGRLTNGSYTRKGYYPVWNVTLEEINELDFFNNGGDNPKTLKPETGRFNLWGNAAFGAYVPLGSSILFNVGAKLDYPIMKTGTFTSEEGGDASGADNKSLLLPAGGLESYEGRMLIPSLQAGVVYTLR